MRRLEETLRQMVAAGKAIGNIEIENKFAEGKYSIRTLSVDHIVILPEY